LPKPAEKQAVDPILVGISAHYCKGTEEQEGSPMNRPAIFVAACTVGLAGFAPLANADPGDTYIAAVGSVKDQTVDWETGTNANATAQGAMGFCQGKGHPDCKFVAGGSPCLGVAEVGGVWYSATASSAQAAKAAADAKANNTSGNGFDAHCVDDVF
jgi:hypothetical protein